MSLNGNNGPQARQLPLTRVALLFPTRLN